MRQALADRNYTVVLRIYLDVTGLTQQAVALLLGSDQSTVSKIYKGARVRYSLADVEAFRDGLRIPGSLLGLEPGRHELAWHPTRAHERGDPTNRRTFLNRSVFLTALGITGSLAEAFTSDDLPAHIGSEHVRALDQAITQLEAQDAAIGGGRLSETASWLYSRASGWLHHGSYSVEIGEALQSSVGELGAWVGWLAQDADQQVKARNYFNETLLLARMNDDHPLEVRVLCYMCLQSLLQDRPREALQMAKHAQRIAAGWGTDRLFALLHLRAARVYAAMENESGFHRELALAKNHFAAGPHDDDPLFINFVTESELAGITALSYLDLHKPDRATEHLRAIIGSPDPAFRRNTSYYTVELAKARLHAGDVAEACEIGVGVIPIVSSLDSGRVRRRLREVRDNAASHGIARDFVEAHDAVFAGQGR
jgi:transcriptional regulator with XRE-family HTH domain